MRAASARPCLPVQALALPALTTTARRWAQSLVSRVSRTGAAAAALLVNVAAETPATSDARMPRSSLPRFLTPPATSCAKVGSGANFVTGSISDQPFVLGQTGHDVHVLHRLPRRALHQVVDDADDEDAPGALVDVREDAAVVGAGDVLEQRRRLAHLDEGLAGVEFLVQLHDPGLARDGEGAGADVDGLADAALERHQVRDERELGPVAVAAGSRAEGADARPAARQPGGDLGIVPVRAHAVGDEVRVGVLPAPLTPDVASMTTSSRPSGLSGGGKTPKGTTHFCSVDSDLVAYSVGTHRHYPEIAAGLASVGPGVSAFGAAPSGSGHGPQLTFVPHLVPLQRGISETIYVRAGTFPIPSQARVVALYEDFYAGETFVEVCEAPPQLKDVAGTNYCRIFPHVDQRTGRIVVISVIDNLMKGASGQAVQNMNVMLGLPEHEGLV